MKSELESLIRPHYREMAGYVSAGMESGKDDSKVFMNANENPYPIPGLEGFNHYPEPQPPALLQAMADAYGTKPDYVLATRGEDEAIELITKVFCEPHKDAVVIHSPTFGMYSVNAQSMPAKVIDVPLIKAQGSFVLDKEGMIAAAKDPANHVKIVYLCSPNNPTSTSLPREEMVEIALALKGQAVVIVDEAYAEFSKAGSMMSALADHSNLIVMRTLSKAYALAGIRVGVMMCADADFISFMRAKALNAYPLPRPSIEAALNALSPEMRETAKDNIEKMLDQRDRLQAHLETSDFVTHVYPSDANFLLVEMKDAKGFWHYAYDNGFVLRDFSDKASTENCLRISPGTAEQNDQFLTLFDQFCRNFAA